MASNRFGSQFTITTFGESHGAALGVVIDGCPAGLVIEEKEIQCALDKRAPGKIKETSPRREPDAVEILSGIFDGKTTGAPITLMIRNQNADAKPYEAMKNLLRPGHANYTYTEKYGVYDHRGGGRASGRETVARVAAGAVADAFLKSKGIHVQAYLKQVGDISVSAKSILDPHFSEKINLSELHCPCDVSEKLMRDLIATVKSEGDSIGGIVECIVDGMPVGLGEPIYEKLEANLAKAMLSIPATKGFEIGEGFAAVTMRGSQHNDAFHAGEKRFHTQHAGGTLGGISNGDRLIARVAFKPTSSIQQPQQTIDIKGNSQVFTLPEGSRHDPCIAIRGVSVVKAMAAIVIADAYLMNRNARL